MSRFNNVSITKVLDETEGACACCGILATTRYWGGAPLCEVCFEDINGGCSVVENTDERLLGIILECESILGWVEKAFLTPTTTSGIKQVMDKLSEAKRLLSDTGTGEAKELADVSKEED